MSSPLRQPALRQPLEPTSQEADVLRLGVRGLMCRIQVWVESSPLRYPLQFYVDSGASYSYLNLSAAEYHGIAIPTEDMEVVRRTITATGLVASRFRVGRMRGWWSEARQGHPMDWPVFIRMDDPPGAPPLLGLGGVVRLCRWTFDGAPTPDAPFGTLSFNDIR